MRKEAPQPRRRRTARGGRKMAINASQHPARTMIAVSASSVVVLRRERQSYRSQSQSQSISCRVVQTPQSLSQMIQLLEKGNAHVAIAPGEGGITLNLRKARDGDGFSWIMRVASITSRKAHLT